MITTAKVDIEDLVKKELPPLPHYALRVARMVQDVNCSTRSLAETIGCDQVLAARILRAANSPLYALERRATTLPIAVNALGNRAIHSLVLVSTAADAFANKLMKSNSVKMLWQHSVAVGMAAREVGLALGMRAGEELFLCGLLHDFGKLILLRHDAEAYAKTEPAWDEQHLLELEMEEYGYTHSQVGALAARRWELPEEVSYAIYNHHQPSEAGQHMYRARIIDVADQLANAHGIGMRKTQVEDASAIALTESAIALQLEPAQLAKAWERAETGLQDVLRSIE